MVNIKRLLLVYFCCPPYTGTKKNFLKRKILLTALAYFIAGFLVAYLLIFIINHW